MLPPLSLQLLCPTLWLLLLEGVTEFLRLLCFVTETLQGCGARWENAVPWALLRLCAILHWLLGKDGRQRRDEGQVFRFTKCFPL